MDFKDQIRGAIEASTQDYLKQVKARYEGDRRVVPVARFAGHDTNTGGALVIYEGGGIGQAMRFSNLEPKAGQIGRYRGVGFDVGQIQSPVDFLVTQKTFFPFMGMVLGGQIDLHTDRVLPGFSVVAPIGPFTKSANQYWTIDINDPVTWYKNTVPIRNSPIPLPLTHAGGEVLYGDRQIHTSINSLQAISQIGSGVVFGALNSGDLTTIRTIRDADVPPFTQTSSNQQTTVFSISNSNNGSKLLQVAFSSTLDKRTTYTEEILTALPVFRSLLANDNLQRGVIDSGTSERTKEDQERFFSFNAGPAGSSTAYQTAPSINPLSPFYQQNFRTGAIAHFGLYTRTTQVLEQSILSMVYTVNPRFDGSFNVLNFVARRQRTAFQIDPVPNGTVYQVLNPAALEEFLFENQEIISASFDGYSFDFVAIASGDTSTGLTVAELISELQALPNFLSVRQWELVNSVPTEVSYNAADWTFRPRFTHPTTPGTIYACNGFVTPAIAEPNLGALPTGNLIQVRNLYIDPTDSAGHIVESLAEGYRVTYAFCQNATANPIANSNLTQYQTLNLQQLTPSVELLWFPGAIPGQTRYIPAHPVPMGINASNATLWTENIDLETFFEGIEAAQNVPLELFVVGPESLGSNYVLRLDAVNLTVIPETPESPNPITTAQTGIEATGTRISKLYIPNYPQKIPVSQ